MKLGRLVSYLEEIAPLPIQENYDNSGLILGNEDTDISKVLVCLDADDKALDCAIEQYCQLVLSHHPIIFSGIKSFSKGSLEGDIIIKAIKNDLSLYGFHTNFDSAMGGLTDLLCDRLGVKNTKILLKSGDGSYGAGRYGDIDPISGEVFIRTIKSRLSIDVLRFVGEIPETVSKVAVYNGSYDDGILEELADLRPVVLVTGDLKYHAAQELKHREIFTVDAGHYGTEKIFVEEISKLIETRFPELKVIRYEGEDVFTYFS